MSRLRGPDEGFTLVELIVYSVILLIVMGIAATLFIRTLTAQRDTIAIAEANNLAQVTFKEIEADLRNAITAEIAADGDLDLGKLLASRRFVRVTREDVKVREEAGHFMDAIQGHRQSIRQAGHLPPRHVAVALLESQQFLNDHGVLGRGSNFVTLINAASMPSKVVCIEAESKSVGESYWVGTRPRWRKLYWSRFLPSGAIAW